MWTKEELELLTDIKTTIQSQVRRDELDKWQCPFLSGRYKRHYRSSVCLMMIKIKNRFWGDRETYHIKETVYEIALEDKNYETTRTMLIHVINRINEILQESNNNS